MLNSAGFDVCIKRVYLEMREGRSMHAFKSVYGASPLITKLLSLVQKVQILFELLAYNASQSYNFFSHFIQEFVNIACQKGAQMLGPGTSS